jgi:hypothetical protein
MPIMRFTDGVTIDTDGDLRTLRLADGWYVTGEGYLIPCADHDEAEATLAEMKAQR